MGFCGKHNKSKPKQRLTIRRQSFPIPLFLWCESNEERREYEDGDVTRAASTGRRTRRKRQLFIAIGAVLADRQALSSKQGKLAALNWHQVYGQYCDYCNGTQNSRRYLAAEAIRCTGRIALCPILETMKRDEALLWSRVICWRCLI